MVFFYLMTYLYVRIRSINQSINSIQSNQLFLLLSIATGNVRRTFFGTLLPLATLAPAGATSRLKWLGRVERDVRALWKRSSDRPTLLFFFPSFRLLTSSGEIGTSLLPCASLRSPPETLFTNCNKGVVPTLASTVGQESTRDITMD